jgi:hypothetical protein
MPTVELCRMDVELRNSNIISIMYTDIGLSQQLYYLFNKPNRTRYEP